MKKVLMACGLSLALLMVCTPAMAKTEWSVDKVVELDVKPIDTAVSADGKLAYILTKKNIQIYDIQKGMITDTIPLEKKYNSIIAAPRGNTLLLTSKSLFSKSIETISFTTTLELPIGASPVIGKPDAPVTLTVFTDYQCPYCSKGFPVYEQLLEKYPNDVNIVLKHYPLRMHKFASQAAIAALAANKQGKYQELSRIMFKNFRSLKNEETLQKLAGEIGLDLEKLNKDRQDKAFTQQLAQDKKLGKKAGVRGVPSLFINGIAVKDRSLEGMSAKVEAALKKK